MSKMLIYKGYSGSAEISTEDMVLYGKIECINDVVTYEAVNLQDLKVAFEEAVDDYLETCRELNRPADKPMSGTFNVRIGEALHKKAYLKAKSLGIALNEFVKLSISDKLDDKKEYHFHFEQKSGEHQKGLAFNVHDRHRTGWSISLPSGGQRRHHDA